MEFNKEKFLKTEIGGSVKKCVTAWESYLTELDGFDELESTAEDLRKIKEGIIFCQAQWAAFKTVLHQLYGLDASFTRNNYCFGILYNCGKDWIFKVNK